MGTQGAGRKRLSNRERLTAEDDALNQIAREVSGGRRDPPLLLPPRPPRRRPRAAGTTAVQGQVDERRNKNCVRLSGAGLFCDPRAPLQSEALQVFILGVGAGRERGAVLCGAVQCCAVRCCAVPARAEIPPCSSPSARGN